MARAWETLAAATALITMATLPAAAQEDGRPVRVRLVLSDVRIEPEVLQEAKTEVGRIYRAAGITVAWNGAGEIDTEPVQRLLQQSRLILVRNDDTAVHLGLPESALGTALAGPQRRGRITVIFWNRVQKTAIKCLDYRVTLGTLLGLAMSHELGHLLLPEGHSDEGLMKSEWAVRDLLSARLGALLLSKAQGQRIRDGLRPAVQP